MQVSLREHEFVLVFTAAAHLHGQHLRVREYLLCRGGCRNGTGHIRALFCKMQHVLSQPSWVVAEQLGTLKLIVLGRTTQCVPLSWSLVTRSIGRSDQYLTCHSMHFAIPNGTLDNARFEMHTPRCTFRQHLTPPHRRCFCFGLDPNTYDAFFCVSLELRSSAPR